MRYWLMYPLAMALYWGLYWVFLLVAVPLAALWRLTGILRLRGLIEWLAYHLDSWRACLRNGLLYGVWR